VPQADCCHQEKSSVAMNIVSRFEAHLLTIARSLTGQTPLDESLHLMRREHPQPACLSRTAIELLKDTLAKGVVHRLATWGWRETRHLRNEQVVSGRLWQRFPLEARQLHFSPATVEWLLWLTSADATKYRKPTKRKLPPLSSGDLAFAVVAYLTIEHTLVAGPWMKESRLCETPLLPLLAPEADIPAALQAQQPWSEWLAPERVWILEALQPLLANRWTLLEERSRRLGNRVELSHLGHRKRMILREFLDALEAAGRRDLARFLLVAAGRLLLHPQASSEWFVNLNLRGVRLADREEVYRAGLSTFAELDRFQRWQDEAVGIGYYDEGYAASQLWKSDWETLHGAKVCAAASDLVRRYTSLRQWEPVT
jgi:hypothetical protein